MILSLLFFPTLSSLSLLQSSSRGWVAAGSTTLHRVPGSTPAPVAGCTGQSGIGPAQQQQGRAAARQQGRADGGAPAVKGGQQRYSRGGRAAARQQGRSGRVQQQGREGGGAAAGGAGRRRRGRRAPAPAGRLRPRSARQQGWAASGRETKGNNEKSPSLTSQASSGTCWWES